MTNSLQMFSGGGRLHPALISGLVPDANVCLRSHSEAGGNDICVGQAEAGRLGALLIQAAAGGLWL